MLEIIFNEGNSYEALNDTTVYPSGSSMVRSYMEIHLPEDAMTIEAFESILTNEYKAKRITLKKTNDDGDVLFEDVYSNFIYNAEVGKKTYEKIDTATGQTVTEKHLVARQEQYTFIEQKLHDLGIL